MKGLGFWSRCVVVSVMLLLSAVAVLEAQVTADPWTLEFGGVPVPVTVPLEPEDSAMVAVELLTAPPFSMFSMPVPDMPMLTLMPVANVDPGSVTVTVPVAPMPR